MPGCQPELSGRPAPSRPASERISEIPGASAHRVGRIIGGPRAYQVLRGSSRRVRSGPVAVHYEPAPPSDGTRRFAYSVPRRLGTAVDRNRFRRRLRAVAFEAAPTVPPGSYLIGLGPGVRSVSFQELRRRVIEAMQRAAGTEET